MLSSARHGPSRAKVINNGIDGSICLFILGQSYVFLSPIMTQLSFKCNRFRPLKLNNEFPITRVCYVLKRADVLIIFIQMLKGHWRSITSSPNFFKKKKLGFLYH